MKDGPFDYIIVGGGSSGCVLASRLSAQPGIEVLLLEAGPSDWNPWIHVPGGIFKLINNSAVDWCKKTEPEPGLNGRSMGVPLGRVLGGSSSINGMIYIRGQREDYDRWAALGNRGWSYDDVLPYFKLSEDQARGADAFHGSGGPLAVSDPRFRLPIIDAFIEAAQQAGLPPNPDFNGSRQSGVGPYQLNIRNGRRSSASREFLRPVRSRSNLTVLTGAVARRILLEGRRAAGIEFSVGSRLLQARARREVVLSAGAVGSPKLLQLSGIGGAQALEALSIPVLHALPGVGQNFQDHFQARLVFKTRSRVTLNDQARTLGQRMLIGADYLLRRRGALTFGASLAGAFASTRADVERPDVQFHFQPLSVDSYDTGLNDFSAFTLSVCTLRPASRGHVMLRSANPHDPPRITGNYLQSKSDCDSMVRGFRLAQRIVAAPALAAHVQTRWKPAEGIESDDEVLDYIRAHGMTIFHPSGTCAMGHGGQAVVDDCLRVHGLDGLRVVDTSIMPEIVSGNTNAAAIMIAEKAADLMLATDPDRRGGGGTSAPARGSGQPTLAEEATF